MTVELSPDTWLDIITLLVEIVIVLLLFKTVKDAAEISKASRLQVQQLLRPWIGPVSGIELLKLKDKERQFVVTIKNFGTVSASNVVAIATVKNELPNKTILKASNGLDKFDLGPLLPNMEKKYWISIDSDAIKNADEGSRDVFTIVYFSYDYSGGKSGYGMISQYDPKLGIFIHREMWAD